MPPLARAVRRSGAPTWVYRLLLGAVVTYVGWSSNQIYEGLRDGSTTSAQVAAHAVQVAVAAKTTIAAVQVDVSAIAQRQTDSEGVQKHIVQQIDTLVNGESVQSSQLAAISEKLDELTTREKLASSRIPF